MFSIANLETLMKKSGCKTQRELGLLIGKSERQVSSYFNGIMNAPINVWNELIDGCGCPLSSLFGDVYVDIYKEIRFIKSVLNNSYMTKHGVALPNEWNESVLLALRYLEDIERKVK